MTPAVKICGLTEPAGVAAAVEAGARYVGFVFFPKSPRHVTADQAAATVVNPLVRMAKDHYFAAPDYAVVAYKA